MRLSRLFTAQPLEQGLSVCVEQKSSHYLTHVLRLKIDQQVILFNAKSPHDYLCVITKTGKSVELDVLQQISTNNESPIFSSIYQALSKNEHTDLMIQKCTELGVNNIVIFNSERTQIPLKSNKLDKKLQHWNNIAQSACEQCGRSLVPIISFHSYFHSAIENASEELKVMLDFDGGSLTTAIKNSHKSVAILLGAEGGLSSQEIEQAVNKGFIKTRLGPRVLRTETAAISALSLIQVMAGDLN